MASCMVSALDHGQDSLDALTKCRDSHVYAIIIFFVKIVSQLL